MGYGQGKIVGGANREKNTSFIENVITLHILQST